MPIRLTKSVKDDDAMCSMVVFQLTDAMVRRDALWKWHAVTYCSLLGYSYVFAIDSLKGRYELYIIGIPTFNATYRNILHADVWDMSRLVGRVFEESFWGSSVSAALSDWPIRSPTSQDLGSVGHGSWHDV